LDSEVLFIYFNDAVTASDDYMTVKKELERIRREGGIF
jgi:hypothetical protein